MIFLKAAAAAVALWVAMFTGRSEPPPDHCEKCCYMAAGFFIVALVVLWNPNRSK